MSSDDDQKGIPERLRRWLDGAKSKGSSIWKSSKVRGIGGGLRQRLARRPDRIEFGLQKVEFKNFAQHSAWIRWGLVVLAIFLLAEITARIVGLFVRPVYTAMPRKSVPVAAPRAQGGSEYDSILRRNMFNVEGKIPEPFDQGLLDCLSQAKPSSARITLLGTIVMSDDKLSVALVQEEGNTAKTAVKKDDVFFDGKFQAMKVERKKLCFQARATGELEFIEIPDDSMGLGMSSPTLSGTEGITPINDKTFAVKKTFLDEKLLNLNEILQTARAVPYIEQGTGKFRGFLVQSIDAGSPFAQLGVRSGDVLTEVNEIKLDNAGKGLEAFQKLRNSQKVMLGVLRGGEPTTLTFEIK